MPNINFLLEDQHVPLEEYSLDLTLPSQWVAGPAQKNHSSHFPVNHHCLFIPTAPPPGLSPSSMPSRSSAPNENAWKRIHPGVLHCKKLHKSKKPLNRDRPARHDPRWQHIITLKRSQRAIGPILKHKQLYHSLARVHNPIFRHLRPLISVSLPMQIIAHRTGR